MDIGEKEILMKVHEAYRWVVAIVDKELKGQILLEGNKKLDLSGQFFEGDEMNEEEVIEEIGRCEAEDATFNIVGEKSVAAAIKGGIISKESVMKIDNIPYTMVLL